MTRRVGVAPLAAFAYSDRECARQPDDATLHAAQAYRLAGCRRVATETDFEMRAQVASGFPIVIGMTVDSAFEALRDDDVYDATAQGEAAGHAMVIVGYDDRRGAYDPLVPAFCVGHLAPMARLAPALGGRAFRHPSPAVRRTPFR